MDNEKTTVIPIKPTIGMLVSMAMRYDHSFGLNKIDGNALSSGHTPQSRAAILSTMRQLYEEVAGEGFYSLESEERYAAIAEKGGLPF